MRIGIDMLAVQEADRAGHEAGRFGRHLVESILARSDGHHLVLYAHEGLPLAPVPSSGRGVVRKVLATVPTLGSSRRRPTVQRLLDHDPDRLDWLVLLDPASPHYGGVPPTPPLNGPRVASVVLGLPSGGAGEEHLLALRRHDALLAVTEAVADQLRREHGSVSSRVACLGPAAGPGFAPNAGEPLSSTTASQLGRYGIFGPYLLHVAGPSRAGDDASAWVDVFGRLPIEVRHRHHLVIVGRGPDGARPHDAPPGVIAIPDADEATLQLLTRRCSAWLGGLRADGSGLRAAEALRSEVPIVAARAAGSVEVVGDAGLLVDGTDPDEAAGELAELLGNPLLETDLRARAGRRSAGFGWEANAATVLALLEGTPPPSATAAGALATARGSLRADASHAVRPRIAYFPSLGRAPHPSSPDDRAAADGTPAALLGRYQIDLYDDRSAGSQPGRLPIELGRFDSRLFERNDALLDYHAVVYRVATVDDATRLGPRLARRPGLVLLEADAILDALAGRPGPVPDGPDDRPDVAAAVAWSAAEALGFCRNLLRAGARVVVRSPRHFDLLHDRLDPMAGTILLAPRDRADEPTARATRSKARERLDLWDETIVVGQFPGDGDLPLEPSALAAVLRDVPNLVLITFGSAEASDWERLVRDARRLGLNDRFLLVPPVAPDRVAEVVALLDLAIHRPGDSPGLDLVDLLRGRVATVALGDEPGGAAPRRPGAAEADPRSLARLVRDLALDPVGRAALGQAGFDYAVGVADPGAARRLVIDAIERCAAELPRASGRPPALAAGPARRSVPPPHLARPESQRGDGITLRSR